MKDQEVEIRFGDLFAALLKAIRPILCFALIFALLGAGFGLRKARGFARTESGELADIEKAKKDIEAAERQLALTERSLERFNEVEYPNAETKYEHAELMVEQRQSYIDNSLYQALDPFNCGVATLTFYIETESEQTVDPSAPWLTVDPSAVIATACTQVTSRDDKVLEKAQEIMGTQTELRFIKELITVSAVSDHFVEIRVYNQDAAVAEKVVDYLYGAILERLEGKVEPFTTSVISRFTGYDVIWSMNDRQISNEDKLLTAERALTDAETRREKLLDRSLEREEAVVEAKRALTTAQGNLRKLELSTKFPVLIYAFLFLAAGLVLGCAGAGFASIISHRLQSQGAARARYGLPILGVLPQKKGLFARAIRRLEGDPETDCETAACVAAQNVLDLGEEKKLCLVSTLGTDAADALAPHLQGKVAVCGDILRDPAAARALSSCDGAVLVEQRGKSLTSQIDSEVARLKALGKEILGIVLR